MADLPPDGPPPLHPGTGQPAVFGLCGPGSFDLSAYDAYFAGQIEDPEFSEADLTAALAALPRAPALTDGAQRRGGASCAHARI